MDVKEVLARENIEPNKYWDQFFLQNADILERETELAELKSSDIVLEIGAGPGNLTEKIAEKASVIAVEKDERFMEILGRTKNVRVICDDAARVIGTLTFNKVVSNIPYSISKKFVVELLKKKWEIAVLIVQKEFADKMMGGSKLALIIEDCAELEMAENIPAGNFYPPAVNSSLIVLRQKKTMDEGFWIFLTDIFRYKNKDAKNAVKNCPESLKKKKIQHLNLKEARELYEIGKG